GHGPQKTQRARNLPGREPRGTCSGGGGLVRVPSAQRLLDRSISISDRLTSRCSSSGASASETFSQLPALLRPDQPPYISNSRWHWMHVVMNGRAFSRATGIFLWQPSQTP